MIMNPQIISMLALIRKETRRVLRIWVQTIIPPGITMSLYFIIFGTLIGRRIGQMDGFQYMEYIAPHRRNVGFSDERNFDCNWLFGRWDH